MGFAAAAALGMLFVATEGMLTGGKHQQAVSPRAALVSVPPPVVPTPIPSPALAAQIPVADVRWSVPLPGRKLAVPLDAESQGKLNGVAVVVDGSTMHVDSYTAEGALRWSMATDIGANQSLAPRYLAPVDYDGDGLF